MTIMKPHIRYIGDYHIQKWTTNSGRDSYWYEAARGWHVFMHDGTYLDYDGTIPGYREFGPFATLQEAYNYAAPDMNDEE